MQADRFNGGKPPMSMVLEAPNALRGAARVFGYGATKYARRNWQKGLPVTQITDSLTRHLLAYLNGEDVDAESGELHIDHITVNALFLGEMGRRAEFDDRGTKESEAADVETEPLTCAKAALDSPLAIAEYLDQARFLGGSDLHNAARVAIAALRALEVAA